MSDDNVRCAAVNIGYRAEYCIDLFEVGQVSWSRKKNRHIHVKFISS